MIIILICAAVSMLFGVALFYLVMQLFRRMFIVEISFERAMMISQQLFFALKDFGVKTAEAAMAFKRLEEEIRKYTNK